jgi:hypothetical protein
LLFACRFFTREENQYIARIQDKPSCIETASWLRDEAHYLYIVVFCYSTRCTGITPDQISGCAYNLIVVGYGDPHPGF